MHTFIKPPGSKVQPKQVNHCREMFDLGITEEQEIEHQKQEEEEEGKDKDLPLYQPSVARKRDIIPSVPHPYNLRSRKQKSVNSQTILMSTHL